MRNRVTGPGGYGVICDRCGFKYKNHQLTKEWTGAMVCHGPGTNDCLDFRHPQEFIRVRPDIPSLPFIRPDSDGIDVGPTYDCSTYEVETMTNTMFQDRLEAQTDGIAPQESYTIHKIRTLGGVVHIPNGLTVHVHCSLDIGL